MNSQPLKSKPNFRKGVNRGRGSRALGSRVECLRQVITGWASLPGLRLPPKITEDSFSLHINSLTEGGQEEERAWVEAWTATCTIITNLVG